MGGIPWIKGYERLATASRQQKGVSIKECIREFCREERLGKMDAWYCSKCKKHHQATKKLDIWTFPELLIIHIKRFRVIGGRRNKINSLVHFPVTGLDLSDLVVADKANVPIYDLYAVSNHQGGLRGGHYTAFGLNEISKTW